MGRVEVEVEVEEGGGEKVLEGEKERVESGMKPCLIMADTCRDLSEVSPPIVFVLN